MDSAVDNKPGRCKFIISLLSLHHILPVPITESWETVALGAGGWQMLQVVHQPCKQIREQENGFIYEPKELPGLPDEKGDSWAAEAQGPQQQLPQWSRPHLSHWAAAPIQRPHAKNGMSEPRYRNSNPGWVSAP